MTRTQLAGRPGFRSARAGANVVAVVALFLNFLTPQPVRDVCGVIFFIDFVVLAVLTWMHLFYLRGVLREQRARNDAERRDLS